jgi:hypothetical protein
MADVFISYKRSDRDRIQPIAAGLQSLGFSVWFDARLDAGSSFDEEITRELRAARCVLVCWSQGSVESEWVRAEATEGRKRRALVSCLLEPCEPYPPFNLVHHEDLSQWRGDDKDPAWLRLRDVIGRRVRGESAPDMPVAAAQKARRPKWLIPAAIAGALAAIGFVASPFGPIGQELAQRSSERDLKRVTALDDGIGKLKSRFVTIEPALDPVQNLELRTQISSLEDLYSPLRFKVMGQFKIDAGEWEAPERALKDLEEKLSAAEQRVLSGPPKDAPEPDAPPQAKPETAKPEPAKPEPAKPAPSFKVAARDIGAKLSFPDAESAAIPSAASREIDTVLSAVGAGELSRVIITGYYPKPDDGSGEALAALNRRRVALLRDNLIARGVPSDLIITDERSEPPTYEGTRAELSVTFKPE